MCFEKYTIQFEWNVSRERDCLSAGKRPFLMTHWNSVLRDIVEGVKDLHDQFGVKSVQIVKQIWSGRDESTKDRILFWIEEHYYKELHISSFKMYAFTFSTVTSPKLLKGIFEKRSYVDDDIRKHVGGERGSKLRLVVILVNCIFSIREELGFPYCF